ncbi:MAG TPA: hypothetical protein VLR47_01220 [Rhodospirillales bacterium]|nr:hypothetical protein [Rhodospirillales bacterium]
MAGAALNIILWCFTVDGERDRIFPRWPSPSGVRQGASALALPAAAQTKRPEKQASRKP